jgi:hypothetical protein
MHERAKSDRFRRTYGVPAAAIATACLLTLVAGACRSGKHEGTERVSVDELSALLAGEAAPVVLDANCGRIRHQYGTIPGALLLTNYASYDIGSELPADDAPPTSLGRAQPSFSASRSRAAEFMQ